MPLGCFTVALLFLAFVGSIVVIVFSAMKSTDVYKEALARAKADPAVIEAASGESNLAIPISGPKGKGTIYVGKQVTRAMELFRARRGSRTNASAHRSSS